VPGGTQLALALDLPAPPPLRELTRWERVVADYSTSGVTASDHAMAILRPRLRGVTVSDQLGELRDRSRVAVGGMVVARQRPSTAGGIVFLLLEDERGSINIVVPPQVYERHRQLVRAEPLLLIEGLLECPPAAGGAISVLARRIASLEALTDETPAADVVELKPAASLRAVAPPVQSFAAGRRR
jgi:error-prone DNA polymerase